MDKNIFTGRQTPIDDSEMILSETGTAIDSQAEVTTELGSEIRKGMIAVRTVDGIIKNKYRNDVGKLAAWLSASHIERTASKPKSPTV